MATTEVEIANGALIKMGAATITALSDEVKSARIMNERYAKIRNLVMRSHPWNFAIDRVELALLASEPIFDYTNQFQVPSDCLRTLTIDTSGEPFSKEGDMILTNSDTCMIKFIKLITDVSKYDANFQESLEFRLAADTCFAIVNNVSLAEKMMDGYEKSVREARSFDAQEGFGDRVQANQWIDYRR